MKRYLVTRTVKLSKIIEADSKAEAIEEFGDLNADQKVISETAKLLPGRILSKCTQGLHNGGFPIHSL